MDIEEQLSELLDDPAFQGIGRRFGGFNLFEALGGVRRELGHSNFLAFILSPARPHGLGAEPLRRVLRSILTSLPRERRPIRPLDIVVRDLDDAIVYREKDNIDLLIELHEIGLIVAIENKVGAKASRGQLARYADTVRRSYPGHKHLMVFLTPDGIDPNDDAYAPFSYSDLARVIESLVENATPSTEVALALRHYLETLRRYVVQDEEMKELALRIYEWHHDALEFIFECRPEPGSMLGVVRELIGKQADLDVDRQVVSIARFVPKAWAGVPALNACPKDLWTKTGRNVIFEVKSFKTEAYDFSDRILLSLILGPSDANLRGQFFSAAHANPEIFVGAGGAVGKQWTTLFSKELLSRNAAKGMDEDQKVAAITKGWNTFLDRDLPKITDEILKIANSGDSSANEGKP